jgi:hypothetical protein
MGRWDVAYNRAMADSLQPPRPITQIRIPDGPTQTSDEAKMLCERCGAAMYRMHAVWRCAACGFKTDCCAW